MKVDKSNDDIVAGTACGTGFTFCGIMWNGDVVPCMLMRDIVLGNIREQLLSEIWSSSPVLETFRSAFDDPETDTVAPCNSCGYRDVCGRGCRAHAYHAYGTFTDPDPICRLWERCE